MQYTSSDVPGVTRGMRSVCTTQVNTWHIPMKVKVTLCPTVPLFDTVLLQTSDVVSCHVPLCACNACGWSVQAEQPGPSFQQLTPSLEYWGSAPVTESPYVSSMNRRSPRTHCATCRRTVINRGNANEWRRERRGDIVLSRGRNVWKIEGGGLCGLARCLETETTREQMQGYATGILDHQIVLLQK